MKPQGQADCYTFPTGVVLRACRDSPNLALPAATWSLWGSRQQGNGARPPTGCAYQVQSPHPHPLPPPRAHRQGEWTQVGQRHGPVVPPPAPPPSAHLYLVVQPLEQLQQQLPHDELGGDAVGQQLVQLAADLAQCKKGKASQFGAEELVGWTCALHAHDSIKGTRVVLHGEAEGCPPSRRRAANEGTKERCRLYINCTQCPLCADQLPAPTRYSCLGDCSLRMSRAISAMYSSQSARCGCWSSRSGLLCTLDTSRLSSALRMYGVHTGVRAAWSAYMYSRVLAGRVRVHLCEFEGEGRGEAYRWWQPEMGCHVGVCVRPGRRSGHETDATSNIVARARAEIQGLRPSTTQSPHHRLLAVCRSQETCHFSAPYPRTVKRNHLSAPPDSTSASTIQPPPSARPLRIPALRSLHQPLPLPRPLPRPAHRLRLRLA